MRKEEMDVLRAAYAHAEALQSLNRKRSYEAKQAYHKTSADLTNAALDLIDIPIEERSVRKSE